MKRTLATFQTEWAQFQASGLMDVGKLSQPAPPDAQAECERLRAKIASLEEEALHLRRQVARAKGTYDKLKRERDFHTMRHKQTIDEKKLLLKDIKRLREQIARYEPAIAELEERYKRALKDKMVAQLQRDRARIRLESSTQALKQVGSESPDRTKREKKLRPAQRKAGAKGPKGAKSPSSTTNPAHLIPPSSALPANPALHRDVSGLRPILAAESRPQPMSVTCQAPVGCLCRHPTKPAVACGLDDGTWRVFSSDNLSLVLSGSGHTAWVSGCALSPAPLAAAHERPSAAPPTSTVQTPDEAEPAPDTLLATCGGDSTVRLWSLSSLKCLSVFRSHPTPVWSVDFHCTGRFLVSGSQDGSARIWDVESGACVSALRGHVDSVNCARFRPFENVIATASGDKSLSLWDPRIPGQCVHTFFGHTNTVNHVAFSPSGARLASVDSDGGLIVWDARAQQQVCAVDVGPHSANCVEFDPNEAVVYVASDDAMVRTVGFRTPASPMVSTFEEHQDAVQALVVMEDSLVSGSVDQSIKLWHQ